MICNNHLFGIINRKRTYMIHSHACINILSTEAVHYYSNHDALYFLLLFYYFYSYYLQTNQFANSSFSSLSSPILSSWLHHHAYNFSCYSPTTKSFFIIITVLLEMISEEWSRVCFWRNQNLIISYSLITFLDIDPTL